MRHTPVAPGPDPGVGLPPPRAPAGGGHLAAIDVVRFLTVGAVILVHATSQVTGPGSDVGNAVLAVAHVTRSVFIGLSALVLTYSFDRQPLATPAFWRRRYPLVVVPYVTWSAIYVLAGGDLASPLRVTGRFLADLFDGGAQYHLYFILLTFQLYLVFPALMAALRRWPNILWPALAGAGVFQLAFNAAVHYGWRPPVLGVWFSHPSSWLPSYTLYIAAGVATARHLHGLGAWIGSHRRRVGWLFAATVAVALASYLADQHVLGYSALRAAEVFQPADVLVAVTALLGEYAIGLWFTGRAGPRWTARLRRSSDVSFGVYLAHPLILSALLGLAASWGLRARVDSWPDAAAELLVALALVPTVYALAFALIALARRSPASLALSGRRAGLPLRRFAVVRTVAVILAVSTSAALISACGVAGSVGAQQPVATMAPTTKAAPAPTTATTVVPTTGPPAAVKPTTGTPSAGSQDSLVARTTSPVNWTTQTFTLTYEGVKRSILVYRPAALQSTKIPVLMELSGCCLPNTQEAGRANFRAVSGPSILVYPGSFEGHWNAGACCGSAQADNVDDVGFVATALADVRAEYSDASRTTAYLAGYSNGAKMAMRVACQRPELFSAVAVFGATRVIDCSGPPAESVMLLVGTADPEESISGPPVSQDGYTEPTVNQVLASYRQADGCASASAQGSSGTVSVTVWNACRNGRRVGVAFWAGHDHTWPELTVSGPSAQQIMWNWFVSSQSPS